MSCEVIPRPRVRSEALLRDILAVRAALHALQSDGTIARSYEGRLRDGKYTFTLIWPDASSSRLLLEVDGRCLSCVEMLVGVSDCVQARSLLALLRSLDDTNTVPQQDLRVFVHRNAMTLRFWVKEEGMSVTVQRFVRTAAALRSHALASFGARHVRSMLARAHADA